MMMVEMRVVYTIDQSVTFLVSKPVSKPKCQSQECDIFGFDTGFETKMSFSAIDMFRNKKQMWVGGGWHCRQQGTQGH